jgi:5-formyltetrahydrofolate cyclo-ligase
MAPTYFRREPGIDAPTAAAAPYLFPVEGQLSSAQGCPPAPDEVIAHAKASIRREALARRSALPPAMRAQAAETIAARPFPCALPAGAIASGFMPLNDEINPLPLMHRLADAGAKLALPAVAGRGKPLVMRAFAFGDPLTRGVWGIREPTADAPEALPDVLLVPLLAFDRGGHRVGYGAGYYDLTIHALRARKSVLAVGLAFAAQEIAQVPATVHDARLDLVLTEREIVDCVAA